MDSQNGPLFPVFACKSVAIAIGKYIEMSIKVQVQVLKGPTFDLQLAVDSDIAELRRLIYRETLVPASNQRLILNSVKVIAADGPISSLELGEAPNIKMVVTGGLPQPLPPPPLPSESEAGRLFQLGLSLISTAEGKDKVNRILKNRRSQEQELRTEPLAADMMDNPRFKDMATSPAFLNAMYYAIKGEELKVEEEEKAEVPQPPRRPSEPQMSQEEALKQLVEMGFESEAALAALLTCNGDLNQAIQTLLGG